MDFPYIVAFCGLPSSGKSTLINSLIGERILQSGVCRTTTQVNTLTDEIITDDNGNKFIAIDLPGICDSEESDKKFSEMTEAYVTNAKLICFVSDVNKAFITTHEVNEYQKIKNLLKQREKETGDIYDVAIILTKCDFNVKNKEKKVKSVSKNKREISDSDEDTDLSDLVKKVKEKLQEEAKSGDILLFNAFGRIKHNNKISSSLKKIVDKSGVNPTNNNISFSIKKYCYQIKERQEESYVKKFEERIQLFLNTQIHTQYMQYMIDKVLNSFNNMNENNQYYMIEKYSKYDINYKLFMCIYHILLKKEHFYNKDKNVFANFYIKYYIHMLNMNMLKKEYNLVENYTNTIWENIQNKFNDLSYESQNNIIDDIIFKGDIFENNSDIFDLDDSLLFKNNNSVLFLETCFEKTGGFKKYDFNNKFNEFIKSYDKKKFDNFYSIMIKYCEPDNIQLKPIVLQPLGEKYIYYCDNSKHTQKYFYSENENGQKCVCGNTVVGTKYCDYVLKHINDYLYELKKLVKNPKYILYNKLQILKYLFESYDQNSKQNYHFKENKLKGNTIIEQKILNHPEYSKIKNYFYKQFIGNVDIPYDKSENFVFMLTDEIMYTNNQYDII